MKLDALQEVFAAQLSQLRSAETQLIDALPRMGAAAFDYTLRGLFVRHLAETRRHRLRLDVVVRAVEVEAEVLDEDCAAMRTLIRDVDAIANAAGPGEVKDIALIAAARRIEHLEIASYSSAAALASELYYGNAARSLRETLGEEREADELLTRLAAGASLRDRVTG
jgi:ferritin-like metal-binding protein YciE